MKPSTLVGAFLVGALLAPPEAGAQTNVYRWVDKDGKVQFSDTPPADDAKNLSQKRMGGGGDDVQLPFATQAAMRRNPVTLFAAPECGVPCAQGRDLLAKRGVPFAERNAANAAEAEAVEKLTGIRQVPVLLIGERVVKGFNEDTWAGALDEAGYPRTRLPGQANPLQTPPSASQPPAAPGAPGG
jgi:glutaredoxin